MGMHFTRARELLVAGLIGFAVTFPLFRVAFGSLPALPTLAGVTLLVLAIAEGVLSFGIRSRIRSRRVVTGVGIARAVVLAKASSLLGALMFGAWLGALVFLAPRSSEITAAAEDLPATIVGACCAAALVGAALWLEYSCRTPDEENHRWGSSGTD